MRGGGKRGMSHESEWWGGEIRRLSSANNAYAAAAAAEHEMRQPSKNSHAMEGNCVPSC